MRPIARKVIHFLFAFFLVFTNVEAQERIEQLLDSLSAEKSDVNQINLQLQIASELKFQDKNRMMKYLNLAKQGAEELNTEETWKNYYGKTYQIYSDLDQLDLALENLLKEYDYYKNTEDLKKYEIQNQLGIINSRLNNPQKAIEYFQSILTHYKKEKLFDLAAKTHNNIGLSYLSLEKSDSALKYYTEGIELLTDSGDVKIEFHLKTNLAKCYSKLKKFDLAQKYFDEAEQLVTNDFPTTIVSWLQVERAYHSLAIQDFKKAIEFATQAEKNEPNKNSFQYSRILQILYKAHYELGDYEKSTYYYNLYDDLRENLNIEEKAVNVEKLKIEYDYQLKEQELALENNRKRLNLFVAIGGLIITLLISLIFIIRYKNKLVKIELENELKSYREKELQQVLELKNKELATKTIKETEQIELFHSLQKDLKDIHSKSLQTETRQALHDVLRKIKTNASQNNWEEFELRFSHIYESFYLKLNELHPNLSSHDKRICALIKLNLSTKEISHITKLSLKSIENSRTRLRKKLGLTNSKIELSKYLENLQ